MLAPARRASTLSLPQRRSLDEGLESTSCQGEILFSNKYQHRDVATYHIVVIVSAQCPHFTRPQSPPCLTASAHMGAAGSWPKRACICCSLTSRAASLRSAWGSEVEIQKDCGPWGRVATLILAVVGTQVRGKRSRQMVWHHLA